MDPYFEFTNGTVSGATLFFIIYRLHKEESMPGRGDSLWRPVYKSEIKTQSASRNKLKFVFNSFSCLTADLCNAKED